MKRNKIIFIIILAILIGGWIGSYQLKYRQWPWQKPKETMDDTRKGMTEKGPGGEKKIEQPAEGEKIELSRQEIMKDLAKKIGLVSPVKPVLGGQWFVQRFWFATDNDFYIEYEDGHILRRILVKLEGSAKEPEYKITGYFEPGENDWVLKQGQDTMFGKPLDLYEYDQIKKEWTKKN